MPANDLTEVEADGPVGYLALCLAHIRAGHPITELGTGLVMYVAPTQAEVDYARQMAHRLGESGASVSPAGKPARLLHSAADVAELLSIGLTTTKALIRSGDLGSIKIRRVRRVPDDALRDYIERLKNEQSTPEARRE